MDCIVHGVAKSRTRLSNFQVRYVQIAKSCSALCDPMDCSPPGSSVHRIFQARILEWVAVSFSTDLPHPGMKPVSPVGSLPLRTTEAQEFRKLQ